MRLTNTPLSPVFFFLLLAMYKAEAVNYYNIYIGRRDFILNYKFYERAVNGV